VVGDAHSNEGIDTYVVGIGIEGEAVMTMSALAEAGGVPAPTAEGFYRSDDQDQLQDALERVAAEISGCRAFLPTEPDNPDLLHILGILAQQMGESEEALRLIRKAVDLRPDSAEFVNNLGNIHMAREEMDKAKAIEEGGDRRRGLVIAEPIFVE
jgi:tetratricopeptide (TPR) repeat protein